MYISFLFYIVSKLISINHCFLLLLNVYYAVITSTIIGDKTYNITNTENMIIVQFINSQKT